MMAYGAPPPSAAHNGPSMVGSDEDDESFSRDLKEMLEDGVAASGYNAHTPGGDLSAGMACIGGPASSSNAGSVTQPYRPNSLPSGISGGYMVPQAVPPATSNIPLSTPDHSSSGFGGASGNAVRPSLSPLSTPLSPSAQTKLDSIRSWSFNTYKFTRQLLSEKLGRGTRTVDAELEAQIEILRDTQLKYVNILRLARALTTHFYQMMQTQRSLGDMFSELSQKNPELREEFTYNSETQRVLCKNGETLLGALNFFTSSLNTLCNKTMDDTLLTVKQYEAARVEFDAYRSDVEALQAAPRVGDSASTQKLEDAKLRFQQHKEKFERLRSDVSVKMKFLDENRVKVMHKQLLLFHNAIASYFSGNQTALDETLKQFNIKLKTPNSERPSWLETRN